MLSRLDLGYALHFIFSEYQDLDITLLPATSESQVPRGNWLLFVHSSPFLPDDLDILETEFFKGS